jgi:PhzF family phenazine biosynthesis protein
VTALAYWHVDAFASRPFSGNQAAVIELESWLPDELLLAIAAENMFADTAFMLRDESGEADWELRWFSPALEVELCGHATLASGHVLLTRESGARVSFRTRKSGILEVCRMDEGYEMALPATRVAPRRNEALLAALGCAGEVFESVPGAGSTAIVLLESEGAVRALRPEMDALADMRTMAICTAPGTQTDIVSRVFVPAWGVDEDSATGSAHAALAPFWADRLGRDSFSAYQASPRGGELTCRLDGERAWIGGQCVTVVEGTFRLS